MIEHYDSQSEISLSVLNANGVPTQRGPWGGRPPCPTWSLHLCSHAHNTHEPSVQEVSSFSHGSLTMIKNWK